MDAWSGSADYSHGFFILPICLYIIWTKKTILSAIPVKGSYWGLVIILVSLCTYIFAHYAEIITLASLSLLPLVAGVIIYLFGFLMLKELLFPLFLLLFMIPIPSQIYSYLTIPLQLFVSKVSVSIAAILGVPLLREGNVIHLSDKTFQVVRACSGLRSIVSLLTLSAVFGYFTMKSNLLRLVLFVSAVPVAILVNIVRVLMMILAYHYFRYDLTHGNVHTFLGMFIFVLALFCLLFMKGILSPWDRSLVRG